MTNKNPKKPVAYLIQHASDLGVLCGEDIEALAEAGLDRGAPVRIDELVTRCANAEAEWQVLRGDRKNQAAEVRAAFSRARKMIAVIAQGVRDACEKHGRLASVPTLRKSRDRASVIQALSDLSVIIGQMDDLLDPLTRNRGGECERTAGELSDALANLTAVPVSRSPQKDTRNRLVAELKALCKEISRTARRAFRNDSEHRRRYSTV